MAKKKKVVLLKSAGTVILVVVLSLWFAVPRMEQDSVPEAGTLGEQDADGWALGGVGVEALSSGMEQAGSVRYRYIDNCPLSPKTQREIFDICAGANISFELIMALIYQESGWDPACVSDKGQSVGLMQVQERWHREVMDKLGCSDLANPVQNVRVGTELLRRYFIEYQEPAWALMAYNGGQAYADRMIAAGKISRYAAAVLERAAEYERRAG